MKMRRPATNRTKQQQTTSKASDPNTSTPLPNCDTLIATLRNVPNPFQVHPRCCVPKPYIFTLILFFHLHQLSHGQFGTLMRFKHCDRVTLRILRLGLYRLVSIVYSLDLVLSRILLVSPPLFLRFSL